MTRPVDNDTIYEATESFVANIDGQEITVISGTTRVRAGHKLLAGGRDQFFKPIEVHHEVEQATRAPGEKRGGKQQ